MMLHYIIVFLLLRRFKTCNWPTHFSNKYSIIMSCTLLKSAVLVESSILMLIVHFLC